MPVTIDCDPLKIYRNLRLEPWVWASAHVNPKAILFFSSLLPQFVGNPENSHLGALLSLILVFVLVKLLVSSAYAFTAKTMAKRLAKPGAAVWGKRITGSVLMVFGVLMAVNTFE